MRTCNIYYYHYIPVPKLVGDCLIVSLFSPVRRCFYLLADIHMIVRNQYDVEYDKTNVCLTELCG